MFKIRQYRPLDAQTAYDLFYETVHTINAKDYSQEQLDAWVSRQVDIDKWNRSFLEHICLVAMDQDRMVGFGDIDEKGYLDRLYVHARYQGKGIGTLLCDRLEALTKTKIVTHASITAKGFFENRGYRVIQKQQVKRKGVLLTNYIMEKVVKVTHLEQGV